MIPLRQKELWVTSDTHFNHENILKFDTGRGDDFSCVEEMNETLIQNWNSVVQPGDKVYHLGDVFFGPREWFQKNWPRLNGQKRLIVGNHDDIKWLSKGGFFSKVEMWRIFPEYECALTHTPIRLEDNHPKYSYNLHGHIHRAYVRGPNESKDTRYFNCCVEVNNYTPLNLRRTMERVQKGYG